jgi:hypothetical protein
MEKENNFMVIYRQDNTNKSDLKFKTLLLYIFSNDFHKKIIVIFLVDILCKVK